MKKSTFCMLYRVVPFRRTEYEEKKSFFPFREIPEKIEEKQVTKILVLFTSVRIFE